MNKREFTTLYDEAVLNIKQVKTSNDRLNKNIGVINSLALNRATQNEEEIIQSTYNKIENCIERMERSYMDPDTARKIGVIKQQLRLQKDRRAQLIHSVKQTLPPTNIQSRSRNFEQKKSAPYEQELQTNSPTRDSNFYRRSKVEDETEHSSNISSSNGQTYAVTDFDYEMERKLIFEKNKHLMQAHEKLMNIKSLVDETSVMVYDQGQKIDIITDDMFHTYKNVQFSNRELDEANQHQRKSKKKYVVLSLLFLIVVGVAISLLLIG